MENLTVKDLMTKKPHCIGDQENILNASRVMIENNINHLLVTDTQGDLIGILSDRDLIRASKSGAYKGVRDFMNWPVLTVSVNCTARYGLEQMMLQKVAALVVVDRHQKVCGIITINDYLGCLLQEFKRQDNLSA
jgi:predicted transcriptional regulator